MNASLWSRPDIPTLALFSRPDSFEGLAPPPVGSQTQKQSGLNPVARWEREGKRAKSAPPGEQVSAERPPANLGLKRNSGLRRHRGARSTAGGEEECRSKGRSGNPAGRPPGSLSWNDALRRALNRSWRSGEPVTAGERRTQMDRVARAMVEQAAKGNVQAAAWLADRTEGKATQHLDVTRAEHRPRRAVASGRADCPGGDRGPPLRGQTWGLTRHQMAVGTYQRRKW